MQYSLIPLRPSQLFDLYSPIAPIIHYCLTIGYNNTNIDNIYSEKVDNSRLFINNYSYL